ncbi:hypothetical protein [Aquitalea magnusonii]|uniref:hypothetical protein n=1 Tax=Aquitalea magnusonii TaxID=332411 RepID=UPI0011AE31AA|nr:hypothetical protein [Aquitalea magnusonii]
MSPQEELANLISQLSPERVSLLIEMGHALTRSVVSQVASDSDIVVDAFERDFSGRLLLFHAMHDAALTKKTFEYFFCGSSRAAGRHASQTENSVYPGEDVVVDGHKFSLKTEGGLSISSTAIHISKLMEARWIRECHSAEDFCTFSKERIGIHLSHYERIISLRSFHRRSTVLYELVEIPKDVLLEIFHLNPSDFSARTANGSSSAEVRGSDGRRLFVLSLDGSVEKITVRSLQLRHCKVHATWEVTLA